MLVRLLRMKKILTEVLYQDMKWKKRSMYLERKTRRYKI